MILLMSVMDLLYLKVAAGAKGTASRTAVRGTITEEVQAQQSAQALLSVRPLWLWRSGMKLSVSMKWTCSNNTLDLSKRL